MSPVEYIVAESGCWEWQRRKNEAGYGRADIDRKNFPAHRVIYERFKGPIPAGLVLDHLCSNPGCVNPDHLEPVTTAENIRRGRGTKLTKEDVQKIRELGTSVSKADLGRRFGVNQATIRGILRGVNWRE